MTDVIKLDGSPGGGKSYTLEQRLRDEKDDGLGLFDFWWLNFTTSGREDVEPTLKELWPDPRGDANADDRAKTVHGLALSLCVRDGVINTQDDEDRIIQEGTYTTTEYDPYADFCDKHNVPYDPDAAGSKLVDGRAKGETGNKLFSIADHLRSTCQPREAWRRASEDIRIDGATVKRLLKAWDEYKRTHDPRLYEHGDYLETAIDRTLTPDVDVLLIDEFQDLAPLEYKLYKQWRDSGQVEKIYIAGDENQAIYSFRGGKPKYFVGTDVDRSKTLKESYRCPSKVAKVGKYLLDSHPGTDPRGFRGKDDGGKVSWETISDTATLRNAVVTDATAYGETPGVMLLTRTNYQLRRVAGNLRDVGVPFKLLGSNSGVWDKAMTRVYTFLSAFGDKEKYPRTVVDDVLQHLPGGHERLKGLRARDHAYPADDVEDALSDFETVLDMAQRVEFDRSAEWKRDVLRNALDAPNDIDPGAVTLGTIHSAKGLEAPSVYLVANTSNRTVRQYRRQDDFAAEEHRVYYVGATRSSDKLTIVDGYFDGPVAPPINRLRATDVIA